MRARLPDDLPRPARRPMAHPYPCIVAPKRSQPSTWTRRRRGLSEVLLTLDLAPSPKAPRPERRHCRPPRAAADPCSRELPVAHGVSAEKESGHHARSRRRAGWRAARLELAQPGEQALRGRSAAGHRRKHAAAGGLTPSPDAHRLPPMFTLCRDPKTGGRSHTCRRTRRLPCGTVQFDLGSAHETSAWTRSPCNPRQIRRPPPPSDLLAR